MLAILSVTTEMHRILFTTSHLFPFYFSRFKVNYYHRCHTISSIVNDGMEETKMTNVKVKVNSMKSKQCPCKKMLMLCSKRPKGLFILSSARTPKTRSNPCFFSKL